MNKFAAGLSGQKEAVNFLRKKGCEILAENYRTRTGEIDIIASDGDYIFFAEVKFRTNTHFGAPCESVNFAKQQKIIRTALHYIAAKNLSEQNFRFDVIEVFSQNGRLFINHIENAFGV